MTAENRFVWPVRVYYEDTDAGNVVYHAAYLRFMERARTEWLRSLGFDQGRLRDNEGLIFVVRSLNIEYRRPARLDDALGVTVELARKGRASLVLHQEILRAGAEPGTERLSNAEVCIACVDAATGAPRPLPNSIEEVLRRVR